MKRRILPTLALIALLSLIIVFAFGKNVVTETRPATKPVMNLVMQVPTYQKNIDPWTRLQRQLILKLTGKNPGSNHSDTGC
jgi:hypothetical protein